MPRLARIIAPNQPHHLTARGNRREDIFHDDVDREVYLKQLYKYSQKAQVRILAYCLMSNHIHLVAVPETLDSFSRLMRPLQTSYSLYFNQRSLSSGRMWEGRYYSCVLDEEHLWAAVRYVEMNPVRAGMVEHAADYKWSSAQYHSGLSPSNLLDKDFPPKGVIENWQNWLEFDNLPQEEALQRLTESGRPAGSLDFIMRLEKLLKRKIQSGNRGRPKKEIK